MEKLINLLNEYKQGKPFQFTGYDEEYWMFDTNLNMKGNTSLPAETIICKKFWFIQWLRPNCKTRDLEEEEYLETGGGWVYSEYESMLMLLAIQDDPISFLVSILK